MRTIVVLIALLTGQASAQEGNRFALHGFASVGSAATYRGVLRGEPGLHWQGGLEVLWRGRFFASLHTAEGEYTTFDGVRSRGHTVDYAAGWRGRAGEAIGLDLRLRHGTFPALAATLDYDFTELAATLSWRERWALLVAYYDDGPAFTGRGAAAEALWRVPWLGNELSAALGGGRYFYPVVQSYAYWDLGVSRGVGPLAFDLRYHYSPRKRLWVGRRPANGLWIVSVTAGF